MIDDVSSFGETESQNSKNSKSRKSINSSRSWATRSLQRLKLKKRADQKIDAASDLMATIDDLQRRLEDKDEEISELKEQLTKMEDLHSKRMKKILRSIENHSEGLVHDLRNLSSSSKDTYNMIRGLVLIWFFATVLIPCRESFVTMGFSAAIVAVALFDGGAIFISFGRKKGWIENVPELPKSQSRSSMTLNDNIITQEDAVAPGPIVATVVKSPANNNVQGVISAEIVTSQPEEEKKSGAAGNYPTYGTPEYFKLQEEAVQARIAALTPERKEALEQMRDAFKDATCTELEQGIGTFRLNDATYLRFLAARKFEFERAQKMLAKHLEWRNKTVPAAVVPKDIYKGIKSGLSRIAGRTKTGEPLLLVEVRNFNTSDFKDADEFVRLCSYFFEFAIQLLYPDQEKGVILFDMGGFSLSRHFNKKAASLIFTFLEVVQDHNPERLRKLMLLNTPSMFRFAWKVIKGLLDPVVQQKVHFLTNMSALLEDIDEDQLYVVYGGTREEPYPVHGYDQVKDME